MFAKKSYKYENPLKYLEKKPITINTNSKEQPILKCTNSCSLNLSKYSMTTRLLKEFTIYVLDSSLIIDLNNNAQSCTIGENCMTYGQKQYFLKWIVIRKSEQIVNNAQYPLEINFIHLNSTGSEPLNIICLLSPDSKDLLGMLQKDDEIISPLISLIEDSAFWKEYKSDQNKKTKETIKIILNDMTKSYLREYGQKEFKVSELFPNFKVYETYVTSLKTRNILLNKVCKISCSFLKEFALNVISMTQQEYDKSEWGKYCTDENSEIVKKVTQPLTSVQSSRVIEQGEYEYKYESIQENFTTDTTDVPHIMFRIIYAVLLVACLIVNSIKFSNVDPCYKFKYIQIGWILASIMLLFYSFYSTTYLFYIFILNNLM